MERVGGARDEGMAENDEEEDNEEQRSEDSVRRTTISQTINRRYKLH